MKAAWRSIADLWPRTGEAGATMVEYGLMVALVALVVAGGASMLGSSLATGFQSAGRAISGEAADEPAEDADEPLAEAAQGAADPAPAAAAKPPKGPSGKSAQAPGQVKKGEAP